MSKEKNIIDSWKANAASWISLIESNAIESRKLATNKAILDAVLSVKPSTALDIGCGEGWLAKALYDKGIAVSGFDVIPGFVEKTSEKVPGQFFVGSYEDMADGKFSFASLFDAIVINFALPGKESTEKLLQCLPHYLSGNGKLFIQTLHPATRKEIDDYTTGWKEGSWDGLGGQFTQPYQWYFRTMEDWLQLLHDAGFNNVSTRETIHPHSGKRLSILFECSPNQ